MRPAWMLPASSPALLFAVRRLGNGTGRGTCKTSRRVYLRLLKLRGFKSFPQPVEVRLEPGVAVIVGPNGSGKSNLGDAIVWAAGSLAPSALRAEKPEDVLFAGAPGHGAATHCEVELVFDNSEGDGPLPYTELSIARRLHRGGEGQYLVNRASARRTDVLEVLGDTGLGHEMHAIIGQGRVEQVLSSKPAERRALIEEAAGLGGFKQRRHRAELKLARVKIQVDRARALEDEARKRLRPLALQASAAERARKLREEVERARAQLFAADAARLDAALESLAGRRTEAELLCRRLDQQLEGVLAERHRAEEQIEQAVTQHEQATAALYRLRSVVERLSLRCESAEEMHRALQRDAGTARRLADAPYDPVPVAELAAAEQELEEAEQRSRLAAHTAASLESATRLARERLDTLERSLAEREGLPPAARALADRGEQLALAALEVDAGYERAVAAALSWRASAVVAGDRGRGFELVEQARAEGLGGLTVLVPPAEAWTETQMPPVAGAEPLSVHVRPLQGYERVARLLQDVWVVDAGELAKVEHGVAVTRDGHGFDPLGGELWFAGVAAESVLLGLQARRSSLAAEVAELSEEAAQARAEVELAHAGEQAAQARVGRARAVTAARPQRVEPQDAALLEHLSGAAGRLIEALGSAVRSAGRFEPPLLARVDAGTASTGALGEELRRLGAREAEVRRSAGEAAKAAGALEVEAARLSTERADLERRLPDGTEIALLSEEERTAIEATVTRLERRLEALGQVNPLAAEELEREKEHLGELSTQREDVERSLTELEGLARELAETVERRFEETYAAVERHFSEIVATLFPGGEGRLRLTLPAEPAQGEVGVEEPVGDSPLEEPGVEVELRPAGKKVTRLSLLSGGEKALGALSFLFALFLARPCPFYLLDEVEAALDDTNITRFIDLLRSYSDRAQFIVITHQKRTMEAADILYGVTMGSDGVSQVISKRLRGADTAVAASA